MKFNNIPLNLILVQEECAEVIQAISKVQRFGRLSERKSVPGETAEDRLKQEVGDLIAVLMILYESVGWDEHELEELTFAKVDKLEKYYEISSSW